MRSRGVAETKPRRDQSCEHCRESRNFPNCVHWHIKIITRIPNPRGFPRCVKTSAVLPNVQAISIARKTNYGGIPSEFTSPLVLKSNY